MIRRSSRPPSSDEIRQLLIAAFCAGMVITAAYFILFVVK
jgi:hypothetical protein